MAVDPRTPCLIGVAQRTWHLSGTDQAPEPLEMLAEVVDAAAADASASGGARAVLDAVDSLRSVYCLSWPYDDPPGRLAQRLGIDPRDRSYSGLSGTVPQQLLFDAVSRMKAGDLDVAVVCGAEALDTIRRLRKAGERATWSFRDPDRQPLPFDAPFHPAEVAHQVFQAWLTFALRDVARRARLGAAPDDYRRQIGEVLAPLTEVAATNPYAWFPTARTAGELVDVTGANRIIGYPYTKNTVAIMDVDMASAFIVATHGAADRLGVPADKRVYLRGCAYAEDAVYVAEHPDLSRSPAMTWALDQALSGAGVAIDDVAHLDLYSCFSSSIHFACDALGLDPLAPSRPLTVTGGLPYAGGPASNYLSHAIAAMVGALRDDPGSCGLVTGVGMHMTKHSAAVLSTEPGSVPLSWPGPGPEPERVAIVDTFTGDATVAAYTVVHDRDGTPIYGLVIADLPTGSAGADGRARAYGRIEDPAMLEAVEAEEWVGRRVRLMTGDDKVNRVTA